MRHIRRSIYNVRSEDALIAKGHDMKELALKHTKVRVGRMAREYREMFSGALLVVMLVFAGIYGIGLALWSYASGTPQRLGFFLMFFIGLPAGYIVLAPFLARVFLPIIIGALEVVRLLIHFVQYMIDAALISGMTANSLYPTLDDDPPNA